MLSDAIRLEFSETDDAYSLTCDGRSGGELLVAEEAFEAMLAMLINLGRLFYQTDFKPLRVAIERPPPANIQPYLNFFAAPVRFSAGENRIDLGRAETEAVLPTGNAELASLNDRIVLEYLARFERNRVLERARRVLIQNLSSGEVSEEKVARELGMSLRNLQRRLREEGSPYRRLLEDTRRELALKYIKQSHLSLGEITFLLGFSETSNFSRAFKRWTGRAPGAYRAGVQH